jgi:hypothetical protein
MNRDRDEFVEGRRDLGLGAALAALPHPELPDDMDARLRAALEAERRRRRRRRSVTALGLAAALTAIVLGGAALAGAFDSSSRVPWPEPPLPAESVYPTNAAGQTYGGAKPLAEDPDLVGVVATNGKHGYSRRLDIFPDPRTDAEADALLRAGLRGYTVPVFKPDGVTQIGVFLMGGLGTEARGGGGGITWEMHADGSGSIVTTTTRQDGSAIVETEAMDGSVTVKTLTAAEASALSRETARPMPRPSGSPKPVRPPTWLLEQMSRAARDAGDSQAKVFWEPQTRSYLKRIEGKHTPKSPYAQAATVWLIVLHGDFRTCTWMYQVLDYHSHHLLSQGTGDEPFDTSDMPPLHGPMKLGGD